MIFLILIFLILTFNGFVVFKLFFRTENKLLLLGGSMIFGQLAFLFILSVLSYFLKGPFWIKIIFWSYFIICLYLFFRYVRSKASKHLLYFKLNLTNFLILIILLIYSGLIFFYANGFINGGDVEIYWGIASSFTRGNYPTFLPWQPKYLSVYHEGAFIVEGAIKAVIPIGINAIHNFFSAFNILAILIFITGIIRERTRSLICLIPAILGIFLFGGPILPINIYSYFIDPKLFLTNLTNYPGYESFRAGNGAGVSDLIGMMYSNFYTFGLASFLIFVYVFFIQSQAKYNLNNYFLLTVLSILSSSIDETFFPVQVIMLFSLLIFQLKKQIARKIGNVFLLILVFTVSFFLIQNPIRDSILTPSPEYPRFKFLMESNLPFLQKYTYREGQHITWNGKDSGATVISIREGAFNYMSNKKLTVDQTDWLILDFKSQALIILTIGLLIKSRLSVLFAISALLSFLFSFILINTYWPPNNLRFANQASQLLMFSLGIFLVDLLISKKKILVWLASVVFIFLIPQFLVSQAKFLNQAIFKASGISYFTADLLDPLFLEIEKIVPPSSRIIFLESYPIDAVAPYMNLNAIKEYGLFVPMSPPSPKVINLEKGMEWYDAVNSLAPYAVNVLDIDYVYIQPTVLNRLSAERINQLNNPLFFQLIKRWDRGILLKVNDNFKSLVDEEITLKKIVLLIGEGKKVYLDKFVQGELRQIFLLNLSKQNHLVGHPHAHGGDFFMYIETDIPFEDACKVPPCDPEVLKALEGIEYALMKPENDPNIILQGKYQKIASVKHVDLWQNIQKQ